MNGECADARTGTATTAHYNRRIPSPSDRCARTHDRTAARGFTLIEIMVLIVIPGILAALVVPRGLE